MGSTRPADCRASLKYKSAIGKEAGRHGGTGRPCLFCLNLIGGGVATWTAVVVRLRRGATLEIGLLHTITKAIHLLLGDGDHVRRLDEVEADDSLCRNNDVVTTRCGRYSDSGTYTGCSAYSRTRSTASKSADKGSEAAKTNGASNGLAGLVATVVGPGVGDDGIVATAE